MKRAIVLADKKSAKSVNGSGNARPLAMVAGLPLIIRNLRTLHAAGIEKAIIVTGFESSLVSDVLARYHVGIPFEEVYNKNWQKGDAHSVLAASEWIKDLCLLVPSDHLYPASLVRQMMNFPASADDIVLAVDRRMGEVFDENECIKVKLDNELAIDVGMNLEEKDAVAPGLLRISSHLVNTLSRLIPDANVTLMDCLQAMAQKKRLKTFKVKNARWIGISSPQARRYAELLLRLHGDTLESYDKHEHALLLNPGPVVTSSRVKSAMGARDMCHREPVFSSLLDSVMRKMSKVFGAADEHDILMVTSSGTGGIEAALSTFVPRDKKILILCNGAFGERQEEIAKIYNIETLKVEVPWGESIPLDKVKTILKENPDIGAVGMVHHETSIGVLNPVGKVGKLLKNTSINFIVDAVSSLGSEDIDVVSDEIDVCISSANKCLHAFCGLASICVKKSAWKTIENSPPRNMYMDLRRYKNYLDKRIQTPFTPAVNTMMSLDVALDELLENGLASRLKHYRILNKKLKTGIQKLGLEILQSPEKPSHSLTIVKIPTDMTYNEIYLGLKQRGFIVYECKGELSGKYFQIANMGAIEKIHIEEFLIALKDNLQEIKKTKELRRAGLLVV